MSLKLYYHPLSSYSWKALIAFYENGTPFDPVIVNEDTFADFKTVWPLAKFPVVVDDARDQLVPESSIVIEYLDQRYPGATRFLPSDQDLARQVRMRDRFYDNYLQSPMQKLVAERLRPLGEEDPYGAEAARNLIGVALDMVEADMASKTWAVGEDFTLADCAAAPALFYADKVAPFGADRPGRAPIWRGCPPGQASHGCSQKRSPTFICSRRNGLNRLSAPTMRSWLGGA